MKARNVVVHLILQHCDDDQLLKPREITRVSISERYLTEAPVKAKPGPNQKAQNPPQASPMEAARLRRKAAR
jgi:hypothetical protein